MKRFSPLLLGAALVVLVASQPGRSADPASDKFEKTKMKLEDERKKIDAAITKYFDDKEKQARNAGNKKQLDQIKDERKVYEELSILTSNVPANLKKMIAAHRTATETAYTQAIKDFTKLKKDEEATAAEKEWEALQKWQPSNKGLIRVAPSGNLWVPLFNGKDLTGWSTINSMGAWKVVDKAIQREGTKNVFGAPIDTEGRYDDFSLRMEMWCPAKSYMRINFRNGGTGSCWVMLSTHAGAMGHLGYTSKGVFGEETKTTDNPPAEKWFTLEITAVGSMTIVKVDSKVVLDSTNEKLLTTSGMIGLSTTGEESIVRIRKMEVLPIPKK